MCIVGAQNWKFIDHIFYFRLFKHIWTIIICYVHHIFICYFWDELDKLYWCCMINLWTTIVLVFINITWWPKKNYYHAMDFFLSLVDDCVCSCFIIPFQTPWNTITPFACNKKKLSESKKKILNMQHICRLKILNEGKGDLLAPNAINFVATS